MPVKGIEHESKIRRSHLRDEFQCAARFQMV
jgi:hypothetical protein